MSVRVLQGSVFDVLPTLPKGSVDVCITSPPYWQLRSYLPKGHALKPLELGSEPTPAAFVANMVRVFALVRDALADHGTCWVNIGDSYSSNSSTGRKDGGRSCRGVNKGVPKQHGTAEPVNRTNAGISEGSLCLIPQRLAIALSDDGWLVRSVVCWAKPAPMPSSVAGWRWARCRVKVAADLRLKNGDDSGRRDGAYSEGRTADWATKPSAEWQDCLGCDKCRDSGGFVLRRGSWRPTSSWEPVLMLAKRQGYFCDGEACKTVSERTRSSGPWGPKGDAERDPGERDDLPDVRYEPTGFANLRDVWRIAAEPLSEKHYAAFPTELVARCLKAGTSARGYCPACGAPWARVVETTPLRDIAVGMDGDRPKLRGRQEQGLASAKTGLSASNNHADMPQCAVSKTLGWRPTCEHGDLAPRPGLVLDPFAGSGRTGIAATRLGLDFVGVELNPSYVEMARRLLYEEAPLFNQQAAP